jgi:hypothetical protein
MRHTTRVWRALEDATPHPETVQLVLRWALMLWSVDPTTALTDMQRDWLQIRLQDLRPFTPQEQRKLVPHILAWSHGQVWHAAMVTGLRETVEDGLLPEEKQCD